MNQVIEDIAAQSGNVITPAKFTKLSVNVTEADMQEVDAVVAQHRPFVRRHAVHLAALRVGLRELRTNPKLLIDELDQEQQRRSARG
jgi:hypothetical protein